MAVGSIGSSQYQHCQNNLDGCFSRIDETIQKAAFQGNRRLLEFGIRCSSAIQNANCVYKRNSLWSEASLSSLNSFYSLVDQIDILSSTHAELIQQVQAFISSIPSTDFQPRLEHTPVKLIPIPVDSELIEVSFRGFFPISSHNPALEFHGREFKLLRYSKEELVFGIDPQWVFFPTGEGAEGKIEKQPSTSSVISYQASEPTLVQRPPFFIGKGTLTVPWSLTSPCSFELESEFIYKIYLVALPLLAGKLLVEYSLKTPHVTESKSTDSWRISGHHYLQDESRSWLVENRLFRPSHGWKFSTIKPPKLHVTVHHGLLDHTVCAKLVKISQTEIEVETKVYCKGFGLYGFGEASLYVEYDQFCKFDPDTALYQEHFFLQFGKSKVLDPGTNRSIHKVRFEPMNGPPQEFAKPDEKNDYIKSCDAGNGKWKLWVEMPKEPLPLI